MVDGEEKGRAEKKIKITNVLRIFLRQSQPEKSQIQLKTWTTAPATPKPSSDSVEPDGMSKAFLSLEKTLDVFPVSLRVSTALCV